MSDIQTSQELVVPMTGEILSRDDPASCARVFHEVKELEAKLKALRAALADAILDESERQGSKTLHFEQGYTAKVATPMEIQWDLDILAELLDAGLPGARYEALVREEVTHKVDGSIIRELEGANSAYAEIINRARTRFPRSPSITITLASRRDG